MAFGVSGEKMAAAATTQFALHVVRGRWFMFFASILIMAAAGGTYIFGIYSKAIKTSLGYDQQTLNTLSFFKDVGANVGILPGLINEVTPPWVVLAAGAGMNLAGYLMIYLAVSGKTSRPPVWLMCLYIAVGANSQSFANTGALVTAVKNFPEDRGVVLGLLKGFVGLSGAIFTQIYRAVYGVGDDGASLVLLMAWLPAAISIVFIPTIRIMPRGGEVGTAARRRERKVFFYFLYASIVLAVYLLVMNVVELEVVRFPKPAYYVTAAALLLLIFFPLVIVIGQSLGYTQQTITTFVSLISIWNYAGRVVAGFASEYVLARYKLPRPLALTGVLLLACAGHVLIALGVDNGLYAASVILGFCFGAQWPLLFAIISEVFGLKYYSTLYNFGAVASPVGSYILNVRVAGRLYDREAERQMAASGRARVTRDLTCVGVRCFRVSFLIISAVTLLGAAVSLVLAWRTREFYRGDLYGKFREVAVDGGGGGGDGAEQRQRQQGKPVDEGGDKDGGSKV
uniref:Nodulin-like domain-containing protein n=1 Tax=Leersia perrieri TaxID=77586 RepID=A0A0D9VXH6_9ORYZ